MPGKKATNAEIEQKVNQIVQMMIKGIIRRHDILQYISRMDALSEKERKESGWISFKKCEKTIDEYIKRATENLKEINSLQTEEEISLYISMFMDMYRDARRKGLLQTANNIMKNVLYLRGLGGVNFKHRVINYDEFDVPLSPEEEKEYEEKCKAFYNGNGFKKRPKNKDE